MALREIYSCGLKAILLTDHKKVAIKEALSELDDLKAGVSQGSVLGYF
jgi:hypothetical protein